LCLKLPSGTSQFYSGKKIQKKIDRIFFLKFSTHNKQTIKQDKMPKILVRQEARLKTKIPNVILEIWRDYLSIKCMLVIKDFALGKTLLEKIRDMSHSELLCVLIQDTKPTNFLYIPVPYTEQCHTFLEAYEKGQEGLYLATAKGLKKFVECLPVIEYVQYIYSLPKLKKTELICFDDSIDIHNTVVHTVESYEKVQSLFAAIRNSIL
jgi:hypothetical protein